MSVNITVEGSNSIKTTTLNDIMDRKEKRLRLLNDLDKNNIIAEGKEEEEEEEEKADEESSSSINSKDGDQVHHHHDHHHHHVDQDNQMVSFASSATPTMHVNIIKRQRPRKGIPRRSPFY